MLYIEVYDPQGNWETVLEITTPLTSDAEGIFRDAVDRLESFPLECESLVSDLFSDGTAIASTSKNDSLTFEDNSVTESLVFDVISKNDSLTFEDNLVTESLVSDVISKNDSLTAINIYKPKGKARGDRKYFRYSYKEEGKTKHLHIGGGNVNCAVAQSRMYLVRDAIAQGQSPQQIKELIRGFSAATAATIFTAHLS